MTRATDSMITTLERRRDLTKRLAASLDHLSQEAAILVVSSFIGLDKLEKIVEFQERDYK